MQLGDDVKLTKKDYYIKDELKVDSWLSLKACKDYKPLLPCLNELNSLKKHKNQL